LKTVEALGFPASQCVVLEDSLNGIKSAKAAGCRVVGITTTFPAERLREVGADFVCESFETLYYQPPFTNNGGS
jgi:beta-phosphoglucomutase-like phosphatase (HAD superfamily)